jgi:hypothetical protein
MSKIIRVQGGDYKIVVGASSQPGNIILDTNPLGAFGSQGKVTITGDLEVLGNSTVVDSETLVIKDNVIVLNSGESSDGVSTLGPRAGIKIDRGPNYPVASVFWDETVVNYVPSTDLLTSIEQNGAFVFRDDVETNVGNLRPIVTNQINTLGEDLSLITHGQGVITVTGTSNYEERVLRYQNGSANRPAKFIASVARAGNIATITTTTPHELNQGDRIDVDASIDSFSGTFIVILSVTSQYTFTYANTGSVLLQTFAVTGTVKFNPIIDDDNIPNMRAVADYASSALSNFAPDRIQKNATKAQAFTDKIAFVIEENIRPDPVAVIDGDGFKVGNLVLTNNNISNSSNDNIYVDNVLNIANRTVTPPTPTGYVKLYSKNTPGTGGTGLFFVNTTGTNDELISKTKALLYSLIL